MSVSKRHHPKAWLLVLPVVLIVAFNAVIPLMTVVNYSVQDTFGNNQFFWVGLEWYEEVLRSGRFAEALGRQLLFTMLILLIEIPLGLMIALGLPTSGWRASLYMMVLALPLLIPWNVVGTIWQIFSRVDIGLAGAAVNAMGIDYNYTQDAFDAWITVVVMDVWHWTSLVALLCYAGLKSVPDAYYQAAAIDGASNWATFRYVQLPRLRQVLIIAFLLRFMDSFMIYTEPFVVTGGGPGNATTFLSIDLVKLAIGQFDLGQAAAMSLIYFIIVLLVCWMFYTTMTSSGSDSGTGR